MLLTDVLRGATCALEFLPLMKTVGQAKVDEFDVVVWGHFIWQHDVFWLNRENNDVMVEV